MTILEEIKQDVYSNNEYDRLSNFEEGALAIDFGNLDKAEKIFNEMLDYNPKDYEAINKIGIIYAKRKDFMLAREYFEQTLSIKEDYGPAFVNIGNTYKECGDNAYAKEYYELAIANDPKYHLGYYNLAIIYKENNDYNKYMKYMKEYKRMYKLYINNQNLTMRKKIKCKKLYKYIIWSFFISIMAFFIIK